MIIYALTMSISIGIYLLTGLIMSLFGFQNLIINGFDELFGISITKSGYYMMFVIISLIHQLIQIIKRSMNIDLSQEYLKKYWRK